MEVLPLSVLLLSIDVIGRQAGAECYSRGAPREACTSLQPIRFSHGDPQTTKVPYGINMSQFHNDDFLSGSTYYVPDRVYACKLLQQQLLKN